MREVEFLPEWYPRLARRRRRLFIQSWLTLLSVGALALWMFLVERNLRSHEEIMHNLGGQLAQTSSQLQQMDKLETLRKQWRQQVGVLQKMGLHVQASRLLSKLSSTLPPNVYFLDFGFETQEITIAQNAVAKAVSKEPSTPLMDRKMRVRLQGVAPTDVELATVLTELNKISFFDNVAPTYVRDRRENGHVLREFELTFTVSLNSPGGT